MVFSRAKDHLTNKYHTTGLKNLPLNDWPGLFIDSQNIQPTYTVLGYLPYMEGKSLLYR